MPLRFAYFAVLRMFGWLSLLARSDQAKDNPGWGYRRIRVPRELPAWPAVCGRRGRRPWQGRRPCSQAFRGRCTPLGEDGDSEFGDLIEDSEAIQPGEAVSFTLLQEQLHSVLDTLSEREAGVVSMRFGLTDGQPKTLDEIGKAYGVTRERIQQIESTTMSKLRRPGHGIGDEDTAAPDSPHEP